MRWMKKANCWLENKLEDYIDEQSCLQLIVNQMHKQAITCKGFGSMSHTLNYILKVSLALFFVSYLSSCNSIQNRKNFLSYKLPKPCALHVKSIYDFGRLPLLCDHIYVYYPGRYLYIYVNGFIASVSILLFII